MKLFYFKIRLKFRSCSIFVQLNCVYINQFVEKLLKTLIMSTPIKVMRDNHVLRVFFFFYLIYNFLKSVMLSFNAVPNNLN